MTLSEDKSTLEQLLEILLPPITTRWYDDECTARFERMLEVVRKSPIDVSKYDVKRSQNDAQ